jgi:MscS family membrane protein
MAGSIVAGSVMEVIALLVVIAIGFFIGKGIHQIFILLAKKITSKTKTRLDDIILRQIEGPLEAMVIVLFVFLISEYVSELTLARQIFAQYFLAIFVLLGAYLLSEIVGAFLRWYYEEGKEKSHLKMDVTLLPFIRKATKIVILFLGFTWALAIVGFDIAGLLTLTSVVALVLGLASQESLANIFAGLALQLDRPYVYGEYLRFSTGEVVKLQRIGLRSTRLEDLNGNLMMISNSEFAKQRITNLSRPSQEFQTIVSISLPIKSNFSKFEEMISVEFSKKRVPGVTRSEFSIFLDKVSMDNYSINMEFWVPDYKRLRKAKDYLNRKAIEFVQK